MERQPSVFNRLRSRNTYDSIPNNDGGDEWYIPYSPNTRPNLPTRESGIGLSPISPTKPSTNYSMFTNVFSTNTNAIAGPSNSKPFPYPTRPATTTPQNTYTSTYNNPAAGVSRLLPSSTRKQGTLYKSPSYNSISDLTRTERIPSSSSVPTGLAGPNILFSPLNRELRAGAEPEEGHYPASPSKMNANAQQKKSYPPSSFNPIQRSQPLGSTARQRTVSAPRPTRNKNPHEYRAENKRWAVPTMCDMFLLPRPTLLPHEITPPTTPEEENEKRLSVGSMNSTNNGETVLEKGRYRDEEREEWAELVKRRGRSLSLGSTAPPPGAPIIGNARARSRERSMDGGSGGRSRSNSLIRALTPSTSLRKRSASFGSRFTNSNSNDHSRKSSMTRRESDRNPSKRDRAASFLNIEGRGAMSTNDSSANYGGPHQSKQRFSAPRYSSDDYMYLSQKNRKRSTSLPYSSNYAKTRSDPLLANFATTPAARPPSESRYPLSAIPAGKSLQFKQPSVADKGDRGGVVIISKGASRRTSSKYEREGTFRPPAPLNLSKPLPDIPKDDGSPILPESGPFISLTDEIGVAISPDLGGVEKEKVVVVEQEEPKTAPLPRTSDSLSPVKSRLSDGGSATARAFLAKQQQRARTKRAFQSPSSKGAIIPTRAKVDASAGQGQGHLSTSASTPTTASTSISSVFSPTPSTISIKSDGPRRKTALEEAIGRSRASSVGILEQQQSRFSPTRIALLENRPNTSESRDKKFGGNTNSVPPPPRVSVHSPTKNEQQRFSSPDLSYSISPPALDYPISTIPSPRTRSHPTFLDVQHQRQPQVQVPRPGIVHGDTNVSKVTVYTDASEGWSRVGGSSDRSTPVSDRKDRGSLASEESPGQTPDDRDFQGLFFRTPADRNGSFSNTPIPNHYVPSHNHLTLPRVIPEGPTPVRLGYDMDPTPHSQIVLQDEDQPRRPSDGSESTAEIATPNMAQSQAEMQQPYMGYLNQLDQNAVNPDANRVQQRLMAPWNSRRPITPDSPDREEEEEDERDERSQDTHETAIPILSEGHEFPFPRSHDTIRTLSQAHAQAQAEAQEESATQTTPDGKRRHAHPPHAPLSPGTFGIIADTTDNSTSTSTSKHINFAPSSFQNYTLNPHSHSQASRGLSLSPIPSHGSAAGSSTSPVLGFDHRHSAAVSFFDEFPTPPGEHQ
ncbi:hypothetical protein I302_105166 [Kwoniella bestiolae CBS 10118]|uniref:Uncharacterized protein n=1 Tax=Kwoniella bestiolae CBS 10118 TaxID=1296100 RepID=A0A1B9FSC6_9TREE|nr:hypothetical protein I302_08454 [Kwoniella bestiolae CBS 10118]OCF21677.1 hypothetical protein I302_08454 [Kwoniella bestiolae CBS 10118]